MAHHRPMNEPRLPAGRPPWEPVNGMRVGGFAGLIVGTVVAVLVDTGALAFIIAFAVIGAVAGYVAASRRMEG